MTDSTNDASLIFDFPMDEIIDGKVSDLSLSNLSATVQGTKIVPDDRFGSCLLFDGVDAHIALDPAPLANISDQITVSFWAFGGDTLPKSAPVFSAADASDNKVFTIQVPGDNNTIYWDCGGDGNGFDRVSKEAQVADFKGRWNHWVFTKDVTNGVMQIYLNGQLWHTDSGKSGQITAVSQSAIGGEGGIYWHGKLAHFSIYSRVLSVDEIRKQMQSAQNAQSAFRMTYPLDISFTEEDQPNVLYISEGNTLHTLQVTVANMSEQTIAIERIGSADIASADAYHFEIKFKPQTFQAVIDADQLDNGVRFIESPAMLERWSISQPQAHPDGKVSLYLLYIGATRKLLSPKDTINVALQYSSADRSGGARSTTVQFLYDNLHYLNGLGEPDTAVVAGTRIKTFDIINQRGKKNIPLMAGVIGSNKILNNGDDTNTIRIRVANMLKPAPESSQTNQLMFNVGNLNTERDTKFTLWFDDPAGMAWDLATSDQLEAIELEAYYLDPQTQKPQNFTATQNTQGSSVSWEITPSIAALGPEEYFEIKLTNIKTYALSGIANIYLRYEDIQGYWDGEFVVQVEKTPITHDHFERTNSNNEKFYFNNVGIGILPDADNQLKIGGNTVIESGLNSTSPLLDVKGPLLAGKYVVQDGQDGGPDRGIFLWKYDDPNWGIYMGSSVAGKSLAGNAAAAGAGFSSHALRFRAANLSSTGFLFENTNEELLSSIRGSDGLAYFKGNVGIGTTTPSEKLDVNGNIKAGTTERPFYLKSGRFSDPSFITNGNLRIGTNNGAIYFWINGKAETDNNPQMILSTFGNLGIGRTAPTAKLHVNGDVKAGQFFAENSDIYFTRTNHNHTGIGNTSGHAAIENAADYECLMILGRSTTSGRKVGLWDHVTVNGTLKVTNVPFGDRGNAQYDTGTKQFYYDNSSRRYKEKITPLTDKFDKILEVQPKTYTRPGEDPDYWELGYIAEEFDELGLKKLVSYDEEGLPSAINYTKMTLYVVEVLKGFQKRLEALEKRPA